MSKGSRNRTRDWDAYRENYDRIFRPPPSPVSKPKEKPCQPPKA